MVAVVRTLFASLRQPRYAALTALMVLVAVLCVAAGTWQIARLDGKVGTNDAIRHNAKAPAVPVSDVLPLVGAPRPSDTQVEYRRVTATGTYDAGATVLVRQRIVDGDSGYLVLTPLRTDAGALLVVRGFIASPDSAVRAPVPPAPPAGRVTVSARLEPGETRNDGARDLPAGQVQSINPVQQASRLGQPVFYGYGELEPGSPGAGGLLALPAPDLSNPAGGAVEPQHVAYIIQWYLFAVLALAAPVVMVRHETRESAGPDPRDELAEFDTPADAGAEPTEEQLRAARLAARYGRPVR